MTIICVWQFLWNGSMELLNAKWFLWHNLKCSLDWHCCLDCMDSQIWNLNSYTNLNCCLDWQLLTTVRQHIHNNLNCCSRVVQTHKWTCCLVVVHKWSELLFWGCCSDSQMEVWNLDSQMEVWSHKSGIWTHKWNLNCCSDRILEVWNLESGLTSDLNCCSGIWTHKWNLDSQMEVWTHNNSDSFSDHKYDSMYTIVRHFR